MKIALIVIAILVIMVAAFLIYKNISFKRAAEKTYELREQRLSAIYDKFISGGDIAKEEVYGYSQDIRTRYGIYDLLAKHDRVQLFPDEFLNFEKSAESYLANWLEFPTELGYIPDVIEYLEKVTMNFETENIYYHVFKFRMHEIQPKENLDWGLGVVGPYFDHSKPYDFPSDTFSRFTIYSKVLPKDEAKWVYENITLKRS